MRNRRQFLGEGIVAAGAATIGGLPPRATGASPLVEPPPDPRGDADVARAIVGARQGNRPFPGMVAAVLRGGELAGIAADGVRKVGAPDRVEVTDRFHLGSCTKAMTATWVGMVIDSGRLRWDATLGAVFPDLARQIHPEYRSVTVDQLLSHRAGLPANVEWWGVPEGIAPTLQRRAVLTTALRGRPVTTPGSAFGYSNLGFVLAGLMAEEASGTPWQVALQRSLFDPLGMTSAGFGPPGSSRTVAEPWGHKPLGPVFLPSRDDNPPVMGPAGTVHASVIDWAKFAAFHLGDGTHAGQRLVSPPTFQHLHTAAPGADYVGGWLVSNRLGPGRGPVWEHAGSNTVWFVIIRLFPRLKFGLLVACNAGGPPGEAACTEVANRLQALTPKPRS